MRHVFSEQPHFMRDFTCRRDAAHGIDRRVCKHLLDHVVDVVHVAHRIGRAKLYDKLYGMMTGEEVKE